MLGSLGFGILFALQLPNELTKAFRTDAERYPAFQKDAFVRWKALDYITKVDWARRSFMDDRVAYMSDPRARWYGVTCAFAN